MRNSRRQRQSAPPSRCWPQGSAARHQRQRRSGDTLRVWLNGSDTPDSVREYLVAEFNELHPDAEVVIEEQQWTGLVERLTTALSSSDSPDVVEMGNTQAQAFEAAGALLDLTEYTEQLGGDDLLQSLLEAGTYDGRLFGVPYYAGARIMIYRTDLFEAAGVEVPTTIEEMIAASAALIEANADVPNFSGFYLPGRNWHAALSFIWDAGGDIAVQEGDEWVGTAVEPGVDRRAEDVPAGGRDRQPRSGRQRRRQRLPGVLRRRGRDDARARAGSRARSSTRTTGARTWRRTWASSRCRARRPAPPRRCCSAGPTSPCRRTARTRTSPSTWSRSWPPRSTRPRWPRANLIPARISQLEAVTGTPAAVAQAEAAAEQPLRPDQRALGRRRGGQHPARHARRHRPGRRHPGRGRACRRGDRRAAQPVDVQTTRRRHLTP